jgi:hypothetical protein
MVMRKQAGLIPDDQTPHNSGSQKFLTGVPPAKPMQVNVGDPHKQAKEMSAAHTCGVRGVTKRAK